jgi:hypothetical protein
MRLALWALAGVPVAVFLRAAVVSWSPLAGAAADLLTVAAVGVTVTVGIFVVPGGTV